MFSSRSIGRSGRHMAQAVSRSARPGQAARSYASATSGSSTGTLRKGVTLAIVGLGSATLGAGATWQAFTRNGLGFYSDEESLKRFVALDDEAKRAEETINSHPLVAELRGRPGAVESRPHMKMPQEYRARSLTGGALLGPRKMAVPPYCWIEGGDGASQSLTSVAYIGEDLCGHPGIVHGGLLATMLDEGLARCSFGALPHNISVTANLNIDYRKPAPAGSFVVLRAHTTKVDGRKCWVKGHIELLGKPGDKPTILAEATALYISPKYAAMMPRIQ